MSIETEVVQAKDWETVCHIEIKARLLLEQELNALRETVRTLEQEQEALRSAVRVTCDAHQIALEREEQAEADLAALRQRVEKAHP